MADHYLKSVELLDEVDKLRTELRAIHRQVHTPNRAALVADRYDAIRQGLQLAKIHAQLAEVQQLRDLASTVERSSRRPAGL